MTSTPAGVDDLALLTGPDAADLLQAALASADGRLLRWSVKEVDHRPGHSTTVSYRARVAWAAGQREESLGASTGLGPVEACPPSVVVVSDGEREVGVWLFPLDPGLPALAAVYDPATVAALFESFGLPTGKVRLQLRAYRPRRRAVIEARTGRARLFLKVMRPHKVAELHERHRLLHEAGVPVPQSLGWNDDGLLVLAALGGTSLREALRGGAKHVPSGADLLALLDRFPSAARQLPHRKAWSDEVAHYARILAAAVPEEAQRVDDIAHRVRAGLARYRDAQDAVHGDFYESQILLHGGTVTGVLDVDTAGPGRRADDLACLLSHLAVIAQVDPANEATTHAVAARWLSEFERRVDPVELRYRIAGVTMSLATGPHRVQENDWRRATRDRIELAEAWVRSAERLKAQRRRARRS